MENSEVPPIPLPKPDRPLLRMFGHYLSVDAAMPIIHFKISSGIKRVQSYNKFEANGLKVRNAKGCKQTLCSYYVYTAPSPNSPYLASLPQTMTMHSTLNGFF